MIIHAQNMGVTGPAARRPLSPAQALHDSAKREARSREKSVFPAEHASCIAADIGFK
jgi:hypothetical protein